MEPMEKKDQRTPNQGEGAVPSSPRKKRILLCCLAAAVLVIGYTALCAGAGRETIYPNVTVNGVNLGGLTQEAAQTALEEAGGPGRPAGDAENQGVVFTAQTVEGESKTYQVPLASVTPDSVASTQRAWQVGHADPFPLRGGIYLRCLLSGEEVLPAYQGGESLDSILDQVEADLARDPVEPTWPGTRWSPPGRPTTPPSTSPGAPRAAGWTGRPSRDRFWTPWAAATWWN